MNITKLLEADPSKLIICSGKENEKNAQASIHPSTLTWKKKNCMIQNSVTEIDTLNLTQITCYLKLKQINTTLEKQKYHSTFQMSSMNGT
ncbi:hypothetical protein PRUPE_3G117100 [Prunus persica]|uniref:Uncharacterized protein n=1 Tax=Prunus persica TaxID=3760 RepID=A0A251PZ11_PRUPE|nr:hypothetical protein PRUPE_3G117100 [Prunus persica]